MASADHELLDEAGAQRGRVEEIQGWLRRRADTPLGRLALQWFRSYFEASRNSGCAATIYSSLSILPAALVAVAYFEPMAEAAVDHVQITVGVYDCAAAPQPPPAG